MAVTNVNKSYDHPTYLARRLGIGGKVAAGTAVPSAHLHAPQAMQLYQLFATVQTAGTAAGAIVDAIKVEGTTTTTMASGTLGTGVAGTTTSAIDLTTSGAAPTALAKGGYAYAVHRGDATIATVVGWEFSLPPTANICGPG